MLSEAPEPKHLVVSASSWGASGTGERGKARDRGRVVVRVTQMRVVNLAYISPQDGSEEVEVEVGLGLGQGHGHGRSRVESHLHSREFFKFPDPELRAPAR